MRNEHNTLLTPLETLYAPITDELERVEGILRREMRSKYPFVDELVRYGCLLGGKRLRPALLLLSAKATGKVASEHLTLAAVVEMIHTATLVHDDVLDEAGVRRHLATVNARWDDKASLLLGDFLFSHAFYMASTTDSTLACQLIGRSTNVVCEGEIRQKGSQADFFLSEEDYFEILDAKTAELCACCCRLGAHFAGASSATIQSLTKYGRYLGIAFQIADDLLDMTGDEAFNRQVAGKRPGAAEANASLDSRLAVGRTGTARAPAVDPAWRAERAGGRFAELHPAVRCARLHGGKGARVCSAGP